MWYMSLAYRRRWLRWPERRQKRCYVGFIVSVFCFIFFFRNRLPLLRWQRNLQKNLGPPQPRTQDLPGYPMFFTGLFFSCKLLNLVVFFHFYSSPFFQQELDFEQQRIQKTNIIVCTPGRLLQHMDETPNFDCSTLKMLGKSCIF